MDKGDGTLNPAEGAKMSNWTRRAAARGSTVQILMGREMGFPFYSRSGDYIGNGHHYKHIGRQIFNSRSNYTGPLPIDAKLVELKESKVNPKLNDRGESTWSQIKVKRQSRVEVCDGYIWEKKNNPSIAGMKSYTEKFYEVQSDANKGFKCLAERKCQGHLESFDVHHGRMFKPFTVRNTCGIVTLTEAGYLHMFDVVEKHSTALQLKSTLARPVRFTALEIEQTDGRMFVVATEKGILRSIYTVTYPPWRIERILHFETNFRTEFLGSVILILRAESVSILDVDMTYENAEETDILVSESQKDNVNCEFWPGVHERVLKKKPEMLDAIKVAQSFFGIVDAVWPPLFLARTSNHLQIGKFTDHMPIWQISTTRFSINSFASMPDGSPNVIFHVDDEYKVLNIRRTETNAESQNSHEVVEINPFLPDAPIRPAVTSRRSLPMRAVAIKTHEAIARYAEADLDLLGVTYSSSLDLIAVCTVDRQNLHVTLYEPNTLKFYKRLPSLKLWPRKPKQSRRCYIHEEEDEVRDKDKISKFSIEFEYEFISVCITYTCNDMDLFCFRTMNEH